MVNIVTLLNTERWVVNSETRSKVRRFFTIQTKTPFIIAVVLGIMIVTVVAFWLVFKYSQCESNIWPSYKSESELGIYKQAAVATDAAPCAPVGKDILLRNGSAVDAAIATLVCMGAHNPQSMGLGGGFLMMYYNRREEKVYYIDSREVAPRKSSKDMFGGNATLATEGGLSIAVPGELAGYEQAHRLFGHLPWKDLFIPTIKMCRKGILVSKSLADAIESSKEALKRHKVIRSVFLKNGTDVYKEGERIKMPTLARTLEVIAHKRRTALYGPSEMADNFLADLKSAGSIIDRIDLEKYRPRMRKPVQVKLRKNTTTLYSVSMPGSGAVLAFMLALLDGYPEVEGGVSMKEDEGNATLFYHRMVEAFKYAYAHRSQLEDEDSKEIKQLLNNLTSSDYIDYVRSLINDSKTFDDPEHYSVPLGFSEDNGTSHLSVVAPDGDAVSVTSTINQFFGSMIMSPSTGIILNDEMDDFSSPDIVNAFDVSPTHKNSIRPGKRPFSSMCPSIFLDNQGNVTLVLGGIGGTKITTSVLQVAARVLFLGENIKESIDAPRMHHQLIPDVLLHENNFPKKLAEKLSMFGHKPEIFTAGMKGIVMGVMRDKDGRLYANSDYRKGGEVDGF